MKMFSMTFLNDNNGYINVLLDSRLSWDYCCPWKRLEWTEPTTFLPPLPGPGDEKIPLDVAGDCPLSYQASSVQECGKLQFIYKPNKGMNEPSECYNNVLVENFSSGKLMNRERSEFDVHDQGLGCQGPR